MRTEVTTLVTPQEAVHLERGIGIESLKAAVSIAEEYAKAHNFAILNVHHWQFSCMLSVIYNAGRVRGIRAERKKRKAKSK